jgi:hypothetical protein
MLALTAGQHSQIANDYEKAAADQMVPPEQREAFSRKANWFRMLVRRKQATTANKERRTNDGSKAR